MISINNKLLSSVLDMNTFIHINESAGALNSDEIKDLLNYLVDKLAKQFKESELKPFKLTKKEFEEHNCKFPKIKGYDYIMVKWDTDDYINGPAAVEFSGDDNPVILWISKTTTGLVDDYKHMLFSTLAHEFTHLYNYSNKTAHAIGLIEKRIETLGKSIKNTENAGIINYVYDASELNARISEFSMCVEDYIMQHPEDRNTKLETIKKIINEYGSGKGRNNPWSVTCWDIMNNFYTKLTRKTADYYNPQKFLDNKKGINDAIEELKRNDKWLKDNETTGQLANRLFNWQYEIVKWKTYNPGVMTISPEEIYNKETRKDYENRLMLYNLAKELDKIGDFSSRGENIDDVILPIYFIHKFDKKLQLSAFKISDGLIDNIKTKEDYDKVYDSIVKQVKEKNDKFYNKLIKVAYYVISKFNEDEQKKKGK